MQFFSPSELKFFFNIQGVCIITTLFLLLFTETPNFDSQTPMLTGSAPFVFIALLTILIISQLLINLLSNKKILTLGVIAHGLLTTALLIFMITS